MTALGIVGGGQMAEALISGLLARKRTRLLKSWSVTLVQGAEITSKISLG